MWVMLTREFALCLFTNCHQAFSLCSPCSFTSQMQDTCLQYQRVRNLERAYHQIISFLILFYFLILRPLPLSIPLKKSLFCFLYTIKYTKIYHVLVSFVCVSSVTSGGVTEMFGLIAFKAKFTLVSSIQHHLLKIGK